MLLPPPDTFMLSHQLWCVRQVRVFSPDIRVSVVAYDMMVIPEPWARQKREQVGHRGVDPPIRTQREVAGVMEHVDDRQPGR